MNTRADRMGSSEETRGACACRRWGRATAREMVCINAREAGEGGSLMEDIGSIQRDPALHDVVFVCGEQEEEVGACRAVAACRSPVLRSMLLTSGVVEFNAARVYFPDIEPECMHICLEFLYTGSVQKSSWSSVFVAMKVVKAAMFLLLGRLESLAICYCNIIAANLSWNEDAQWCVLISSYNLGVQLYPMHTSKDQKHKALQKCRLRFFLNRFCFVALEQMIGGISSTEKLFSGCKHERLFYERVSQQAFAYLIMQESEDVNSLSHYFAFLHIVRWCASRLFMANLLNVSEGELKGVLCKCFPHSLQAIGDMLSSSTDIRCCDEANVSRILKLIAGPLAQCLQELPFNLAKIPAHILCRFIEPLNVISSSALLRAYRCQALDRPDLRWEQHSCLGSSCQVEVGKPTVISSTGEGFEGFAKCNVNLNATSQTFFDWEVVILNPCKELCVGFCMCKSWTTAKRALNRRVKVLGVEPGTWALHANGSLQHTNFSFESGSSEYADAFHDKEVSIQVHLNLANRSCSFSIAGEDAGLAWNNLPICDDTMICPAISLGSGGMARIQMVHQGWMDGPSKRQCISNE